MKLPDCGTLAIAILAPILGVIPRAAAQPAIRNLGIVSREGLSLGIGVSGDGSAVTGHESDRCTARIDFLRR
jgi:hypothetical protein